MSLIDSDLTVSGNEGKLKPQGVRFGIAIFLGVVMWIAPFLGMNAVLLPARVGMIDPDAKVGIVAMLAIAGSIVALVANILFGAFSDLTRSRFGRRIPWMFVGSIGTLISLTLLNFASSVTMIVVWWCCFQFFLNAIVAPLVTVIPDRVPEDQRGTFSAVYGVSMMVGVSVGQLIASRFIENPETGTWVFAAIIALCAPVFALLAPDKSNKDVPKPKFSAQMVLVNFSFPMKGARDFYFALSGKLLFVLGLFAISGYQVYILTDYMGATPAEAGNVIAGMSIINLITGLIFGAISGPISDKVGKRKIFVIGSAALVAVATMFPFFVAKPWAMLVYAVIMGVGSGVYNSVDQALNYEVLPNPDTAAKDLGILNMANTGGQILGPVVTSAVVGLTAGYGGVFLVAAGILVVSAGLIKPIRKAK